MSLTDDAALWWRTLGPLPVQMHAFRVVNDARKAAWKPGLPVLVAFWRQRGQDAARLARHEPLVALGAALGSAPQPEVAALRAGKLVLAGREVAAFPPDDWALPGARPLEVYEAHYLDWADALVADALLTDGGQVRALLEPLQAWAASTARLDKPWEPYPRARRTLAATRAAARLTRAEHHGRDRWTDDHAAVRDLLLAIAAAAACDLGLLAERHLDGNHLLVDRAAQAVAELAWGRGVRACDALTDEVERQFPGDGAHVEASPMYHAQLVEDLLTVRALWPQGPARMRFEHLLQRALGWLAAVRHPDGRVPAFGDTDPDVLDTLTMTRTALGGTSRGQSDPRQSVWLSRHGGHFAVVHSAPPTWTPQPGHAHADSLSLEWSRNDVRILADAGLAGYEGDPHRELNRSEPSHSTVQVREVPQLELWAAFRVGARGTVSHVETGRLDGWDWLTAVHVWPQATHRHGRLVAHHPSGKLVIADVLQGAGDAIGRLLLAPRVQTDGVERLRIGRDRIAISASRPLTLATGLRFAHRGDVSEGPELQVPVDSAGSWVVLGGGDADEARERFAAPWAALAARV